MRLVLLFALIQALVPGLGEIAETAVHYAMEGHLAHSDADRGDLGDLGHEHGCGGTQHLCDCCASQAFLAQPSACDETILSWQEAAPAEGWRLASLHDPAPPRRPPIAS
jgi:hypothetical protein